MMLAPTLFTSCNVLPLEGRCACGSAEPAPRPWLVKTKISRLLVRVLRCP